MTGRDLEAEDRGPRRALGSDQPVHPKPDFAVTQPSRLAARAALGAMRQVLVVIWGIKLGSFRGMARARKVGEMGGEEGRGDGGEGGQRCLAAVYGRAALPRMPSQRARAREGGGFCLCLRLV